MKTSLEWLKEYTDVPLPPEKVAETFTHLGLEVEGMGGVYAPRDGIIIAKVVENRRHPNADRLSVNKVDTGTEIIDVVCGAPNCRAGLTVALIRSGHTLPDGTAIKKSKIRGELSDGMLCSERELGLSEEAEGILELPDGLPLGATLTPEHLGCDPVFEIAVLPNRPDCLSVTGLARELSAKLSTPFRLPDSQVAEGAGECSAKVGVQIQAPVGCPRYTARHIGGVKIAPSPEWLRKRLRAAGVRSINNIVDITNFVMLELGQPLHAFDHAKVAGGSIIVRMAKKGEVLTTLDGVHRTLTDADLLICDAEKPVALAGVMGGQSSEVSDATTDILLESAYFEPTGIRRTSKRLGLSSESAYRFERGVDPDGVVRALDRAAALMAELGGGTVSRGRVDVCPGPVASWTVQAKVSRINAYLGTDFSGQEIRGILSRLGFGCGAGEEFEVTVPPRRHDVRLEADLIEEVARVAGYDRVPVPARGSIGLAVGTNPLDDFRERVRNIMAGLGFTEAVTNSLVSPEDLALLGLADSAPRLLNPLSPEMSVLRTSMIPSLLAVVQGNLARRNSDQALFETGRVFAKGADHKQADEREVIAGALTGRFAPARWDGKNEEAGIYLTRGLLESAVERLTGRLPVFESAEVFGCKGFRLKIDGNEAGFLLAASGQFNKRFDLKSLVVYFELDLSHLYRNARTGIKYKPLSKYPPSDRDIAVVTDEGASAIDMMDCIRKSSPLVEEVELFDLFRGKELGVNKKSSAFRMRFRKNDGTLTDVELDLSVQKAVKELGKRFNATLR